jgi:hypothetical protein
MKPGQLPVDAHACLVVVTDRRQQQAVFDLLHHGFEPPGAPSIDRCQSPFAEGHPRQVPEHLGCPLVTEQPLVLQIHRKALDPRSVLRTLTHPRGELRNRLPGVARSPSPDSRPEIRCSVGHAAPDGSAPCRDVRPSPASFPHDRPGRRPFAKTSAEGIHPLRDPVARGRLTAVAAVELADAGDLRLEGPDLLAGLGNPVRQDSMKEHRAEEEPQTAADPLEA